MAGMLVARPFTQSATKCDAACDHSGTFLFSMLNRWHSDCDTALFTGGVELALDFLAKEKRSPA